jgi:rubredoxin
MKIYALSTANTMNNNTGGDLFHALTHDVRGGSGKALCGMKPGRRGYWSNDFSENVTCPKCKKMINDLSKIDLLKETQQ